jgi:hypothetical protein
MKKIVFVAVAVSSMGLFASPSFAGAPKNCVGKVTSYTAQGNPIPPFKSANGIGNVAKANAVSTKDAMNYIKTVVC